METHKQTWDNIQKVECAVTEEAIAHLPAIPAVYRLIKADGKIIEHNCTPNARDTIAALYRIYTKNNYPFAKIMYFPISVSKEKFNGMTLPENYADHPFLSYWNNGINPEVLDIIDECNFIDDGIMTQSTSDAIFKPKMDALMQKNHWQKDLPNICKNCNYRRVCTILEGMRIETMYTGGLYPSNFTICDKRDEIVKTIPCPICGKMDKMIITLMNRQDRPHYYELQCWYCDWSQVFPFSYGFLDDVPAPSQEKLTKEAIWKEYQDFCNDILKSSGYYDHDPQWMEKLTRSIHELKTKKK